MKPSPKTPWLAVVALLAATVGGIADAASLTGRERAFFENRIRPVLVTRCYECHSADSKKLGGKLRLDTRDSILKGGESGPAIRPGDPNASLLMDSLHWRDDLEMPPDEPLSPVVINAFAEWIRMGAPDPRTEAQKAPASETNRVDHWSFKPIRDPKLPPVKNIEWATNPIDRFILAGLEKAGLTPTRAAPPEVLIRRLYFDLIGLPPSQEEIEVFVSDHKRDGERAIERLVNQLLASPHYGERFGRHWLDVARYGESNGNDGLSRNPTFRHAWRYRDYVIEAFNADRPFDRFVTEQIAGDLLPARDERERDQHLVATGFLALGAKPAKAMNDNFDMDIVADQIDAVSSGLMGLSVVCARCHDHKHDPIPTRDYYAMAGVFTSTETMWGRAARIGLTAPQTPLHELKTAPRMAPPPDATELIKAVEAKTPNRIPDKPKHKYADDAPLAMGVRDRKKAVDCKINIGGESKKLGPVVPRGFLSACGPDAASYEFSTNSSGRLELAQWLTSGRHPLTARVMVNRVWLHLFGQALVGTPDDFGIYGDRPSHPDLLDHLATRFQNDGWSVKALARAIVLSRTYRLDSNASPEALRADADNRWYARHLRRRLDAESLRDRMLAASGDLDLRPGEGSAIRHLDLLVNQAGNLHRPSRHRSVYLCYLRNSPPPELAAFNLPDAVRPKGKRDVTTVPAQALHLLNNPFVVEQSERLAEGLLEHYPSNRKPRIVGAYRHTLGRAPETSEIAAADKLVRAIESELLFTVANSDERLRKAWAALGQGLFATSEFRYVD